MTVWGSGFELAASYVVLDANILPIGIYFEMMRAIAFVFATSVIADIDTGFGNAVNVSYVIPQYEAAGVSAVVMEDKTFPKDMSLRAGRRQELVNLETFQGNAAIDARQYNKLVIIARVEALITRLDQEEALRRSYAYQEAGADTILIHSWQKTPAEILAFIDAWAGRVPLVLVPIARPQLTESIIAASGKSGDHHLWESRYPRRSGSDAQSLWAERRRDGSIHRVDTALPTVSDIIAL